LSVSPNYFIAPFWDDIDNSPGIGGGVYTDVIGSAPNRMFIVQWENIPHYNNTGAATFQSIFYEDTQEIRFQYEDVNFDTPNFDWGASATIGIKGDGKRRQYSYNEAVIANQTTIRYLPTLIFPNDLPAEVTARSAISMTALAPDNAADGNIFVQTADGASNEAPFATGDSFTPDAAGIGSSPAVTVTGAITTDTTWTENTLITGDVVITDGVTLTITPGVTIFFAANSDDQAGGVWTDKAEIQVRGALIAQGTITDPIYFTSNAPVPAPEDWGGIVIRKNSVSSSLDKCLLQYATYGVYLYNLQEGGGQSVGNH